MRTTVVIPCFNERDTLIALLRAVQRFSVADKQVIVVDDCSTDGTRELLRNEVPELGLADKILFHDRNLGKGAALRTGFSHADGEIVIIQDADLEYDPREHSKLIAPILEGKADVVYGSRFSGDGARRVLYFWHRLANGFLTILSNITTNLNLTDMETCFKAMRTEFLRKIDLREDRFGFEPEITIKLAKLKCRFYEVGISYDGRTYEEGKKIGWIDGIRAIYCIAKYWLFR